MRSVQLRQLRRGWLKSGQHREELRRPTGRGWIGDGYGGVGGENSGRGSRVPALQRWLGDEMLKPGGARFTYNNVMRAWLAAGLLCCAAVSARGQTAPPNLHVQSRVQSVSIRFAGTDNSNYLFAVKNNSASGITGLDFRLIPEGIRESGGHYQCNAQCTGKSLLGDKEAPAIKAGETRQVSFPMGSIAGGAVILETAVFDSGSYEGNERGAAYLVAGLAGNQTEYNLIVSAVDKIVSDTGSDDAHKIPELFAALNLLDTGANASLVSAFRNWFPDLRQCDGRFLRAIDNAEFEEKRGITERLQTYLRSDAQRRGPLSDWWDSTKQYLAGFGCDGCAIRVSAQNAPSEARKAPSACLKRQPNVTGASAAGIATWEIYWPDETPAEDLLAEVAEAPEGGTETAEEEPSEGGGSETAEEQREPDSQNPAASEPIFAPNPRVWSSDDAAVSRTGLVPEVATAQSPVSLPRNAIFPGFFPMFTGAGARSDETLYRMLFQAAARAQAGGDLISFFQNPRAGVEASPGLPATLSPGEIQILKRIGGDCQRELAETLGLARSRFIADYAHEPPAVRYWGPQTAEQHQRVEKDSQIVQSHIQDLRLLLGESSFRIVDAFLHERFQVKTPIKVLYEPLPEEPLYHRLFRYVAALNAVSEQAAAQETAEKPGSTETRKAELRQALRLDERKWRILSEAGTKYEAAEMALLEEIRTMRFGPQVVRIPVPTSVPASQGLLPDRRREMQEEMTAEHIKMLETALGTETFAKLDARVRELYKFTYLPIGVPIAPNGTEAARAPAAKSAQ